MIERARLTALKKALVPLGGPRGLLFAHSIELERERRVATPDRATVLWVPTPANSKLFRIHPYYSYP